MTELYDALEHCLEDLERGASLEHTLRHYPDLASDLRPLLTASLLARGASRVHVPQDVRSRGRARLIARAVQLREARVAPRRRVLSLFPRAALTAILVGALVLASTGLVSASSGALPGQQLYPVKRTWESVRLLLVFDMGERDLLESDFEQERLDEAYELVGRRLAAPISFSGLLTHRSDGTWLISGIPVDVTASTILPQDPISDGAPVTVMGNTRPDGSVQAERITLLQPDSALPPFEPSENEERQHASSEGNPAGPNPLPPTAATLGSIPPQNEAQATFRFRGVVQSMQGNVWQINGQRVYVDDAQINGNIQIGSIVKFEGYYGADGRFIVTSVSVRSDKSESTKSGDDGEPPDDGGDGGDDGP